MTLALAACGNPVRALARSPSGPHYPWGANV
jgi:hypothetical protein